MNELTGFFLNLRVKAKEKDNDEMGGEFVYQVKTVWRLILPVSLKMMF